jgi:hypothetical protein
MKALWVFLIAASVSFASIPGEPRTILSQPSRPTDTFDGIWEAKMNDQPAMELKINDSAGKVTGTILFYFQERSNPNEPWHVTGGKPVPMLLPHVEGNVLTFELQHHKCHDRTELGPNQRFRVELKSPDEARLWMWDTPEMPKEPGPGLKLERRVKPTSQLPIPLLDSPHVVIVSANLRHSGLSTPDKRRNRTSEVPVRHLSGNPTYQELATKHTLNVADLALE